MFDKLLTSRIISYRINVINIIFEVNNCMLKIIIVPLKPRVKQ